MISQALDWVERHAFLVVGREGVRLLSHIGAALNRVNLLMLERVSMAAAAPLALDRCWVRWEQSSVQQILEERRRRDPASFVAAMRGIDRLLAVAGWGLPVGTARVQLLGDIIRSLARGQRRRLRFASQADRERIGLALIARIRAHDAVVGFRLPRLGPPGD